VLNRCFQELKMEKSPRLEPYTDKSILNLLNSGCLGVGKKQREGIVSSRSSQEDLDS